MNTGKLHSRVNRLYDSGRLQDALGDQRSGDFVRATNDAHAASQTAQNVRNLAGSTAKHTLDYGATWELLKHLFGNSKDRSPTHGNGPGRDVPGLPALGVRPHLQQLSRKAQDCRDEVKHH